jgi:hypothetical protein
VRILLDNCVDRKVHTLLGDHQIASCAELNWSELQNGELLVQASKQFDLIVTSDKNIRYQQNLETLPIAILELNTRRNRFKDLIPLQPHFPGAIEQTRQYLFVSIDDNGALELLAPREVAT